MQKLKKTRRKHKNKTERNIKQKQKNSKENIQQNNRNTGFAAHEPPRKINISKGLRF